MALTSPGVEVTIIDQSQYLPAATGSVPFVLVATAQNKADPTGTGVAVATTTANAGKLYQVTSQRDLVTLYGNPFFYTTTAGTPIQGYELNEYGLLAAYSLLGVTNRCYVLRADIDLASLVGQTGRPTGAPENGSWWLDTTNSTWGINQFNATTGQFTLQNPIVITNPINLNGGVPIPSLGNIGDYAVIASQLTSVFNQEIFYKTPANTWVPLGSPQWAQSWPTIQGTQSNPVLTAGDTFTITLVDNGIAATSVIITVPNSGGGQSNVNVITAAINSLGWAQLSAAAPNGKLTIYSNALYNGSPNSQTVQISGPTGTVLDDLGINQGNYLPPLLQWGTSAQQPLWQTGQAFPRPTGSVWVKVGSAGNGLLPNISQYDAVTASWINKNATLFTSDWEACAVLDPTGGKKIPAGTIYSQYYNSDGLATTNSVYFWERYATGPTVITGTNTSPLFTNGPYSFQVNVSIPGASGLSSSYIVNLGDNADATEFVTAWSAANILYTTASVASNGAIQLTHTEGGVIILNDYYVVNVLGLLATVNSGSIAGTSIPGPGIYANVPVITESGLGSGAFAIVVKTGNSTTYTSSNTTITIVNSGTGYAVGDTLSIAGNNLGGILTTNDLTFEVGSIRNQLQGTSSGLVVEAGFNIGDIGVKVGPTLFNRFVDVPVTGGSGADAKLNVTAWGSYSDISIGNNQGSGYAVGDNIRVLGTNLGGQSPANDLLLKVAEVDGGGLISVAYSGGIPAVANLIELSNWVDFDYTANEGAPVAAPANNTNWFYSVVNQVDIMVNTTNGWRGYRNINYDSNGFPISGSNTTDPAGPIVTPTEPIVQSDGTPLVYGDLWIDTTNLEDYPVISRWQQVDGEDMWVLIDNTDQVNSTGIVFADARWATNGNVNPADDPIASIASLLLSNYLDLDAPSPSTYPVGMLLFNTRRSGYNVKQYRVNYFNSTSFPGESLPTERDAWVSASGLQFNGSPYMGRKAQRAMVVESLRSTIDTNPNIRDEDNYFSLMATPNYPELQPNMVVLNADRGETAYILGDTPLGLPDSATAIQAWATNAAGATSTGEEGCVTRNTFLGLFYPSGIAFDLAGNEVAVPASHMMLRTFLRNDTIAYPWLAAAGTRRGIIDNAANIGYVNRTTGEFEPTKTRIGIRDVLYLNFINPLVFFTGNGLLNYGNKTSFDSQSALDRTNVARLIAYIRRQLTIAARPFVFEPNDAFTRGQIANVVTSLMLDLQAKRGIYDYLVVCDESNNTPARIDRNELWVDVAIEPVKAVEFIYIPVRILNTGELAAL